MEGLVIRDVYYNTSSPACFAGKEAVYREAKRRNSKITRRHVDDFLAKQDSYTLHRQARKRFKRNKTQTAGIDVDWQADLADTRNLKQWNSGYSYLLCCIDVLSRYAFVRPIKKKTPEEVAKAFANIIEDSGRSPWKLTTDRGMEFRGKPFQDFLKSKFIFYKNATSPDVKCAIAERYIRTLKSRIWKYFTRYKTKRYIDILPDLVAAVNNSYHRTVKRKPSSINRSNQTQVWNTLYGKKKILKRPTFKVNDRVRISIEKQTFSKGYRPNYSNEVFKVHRVLERDPICYKLIDGANETIDGVFYKEELIRVIEDSPAIKKIRTLKKSERRNGDLWHLVKFQDGKESWIANKDLISI